MATIELKNDWAWFVTDLQSRGITFLNRLATNVEVLFTLNAPAYTTGDLPSDNPEVNIPYSRDGEPFVSFNSRLLFGMRRDWSGVVPYTCRFAGVIHLLEDEATTDEPVTHYTAWDPWQWLNYIPVVTSGHALLGKNGLSYTATHGNTIALDLLTNAMAAVSASNPGNPDLIDRTHGHFDTTDAIDITFAQGISVGEAWTQLVDTGSMDILLTPIYDPVGRPGKTSVLNVYQQAGAKQNNAIFAWDKMPHSLAGISRTDDGTQMVNVAQYYSGNTPVTVEADPTSVTEYGQYWEQKSFPAPSAVNAIALVALTQVALRRKGKRTITMDPMPERSPDPFTDYYLGDQVPVYAGRTQAGGGVSLRAPLTPGAVSAGQWTNPQRVYAIPISLADDQVETVTQLLLTDANS